MHADEVAFRLTNGNTDRDMALRIKDAFLNGIGIDITRREMVENTV